MKKNFIIEKSTNEEVRMIDYGIVEFNSKKVTFTQEPAFEDVDRTVKDLEGNIIGGIFARIYCWNILNICGLWINEQYIKEGLGSILLKEVENIAKEKCCYLSHLKVSDAETKDFYTKNGYEVFGVLDNYPVDYKEYLMKKVL
jgi:ribosomal protein S18 acetylase RimI-like enzyme